MTGKGLYKLSIYHYHGDSNVSLTLRAMITTGQRECRAGP